MIMGNFKLLGVSLKLYAWEFSDPFSLRKKHEERHLLRCDLVFKKGMWDLFIYF